MKSPSCLCVCIYLYMYPPINCLMPKPIFTKLGVMSCHLTPSHRRILWIRPISSTTVTTSPFSETKP
jgi:hypothetical protein